MYAAEPRKFRVLQAGYQTQRRRLRCIFHLGLETDDIVERAEGIVLAQLHHSIGFNCWIARIGQADRLHGAVPKRLSAASGHHLNRETAVEVGRVLFKVFELAGFGGKDRIDEGVVLRLVHRAVDVVGAISTWTHLVVAGLKPGGLHVDAVAVDDWRDRVEEGEAVFAGMRQDVPSQGFRSQRPCRDDAVAPVFGRKASDLLVTNFDQRMRLEGSGDSLRKSFAIDRKCRACRYLMSVCHAHDERIHSAHLSMKQPDGVCLRIIGSERVGADEFGEVSSLVRRCLTNGPHFVEDDMQAETGYLPGGF